MIGLPLVGDVVKVALGVHIDGYIAQVAHTLVSRPEGVTEPATGRSADVICAAHMAAQVAQRLLRPGVRNSQITEAVDKIAASFRCRPLEGVLSHQLRRFVVDGEKVIMNQLDPENAVEEVVFEEGEAWAIDILISTGEGIAREGEARTTVFQRNVDTTYNLKLKGTALQFCRCSLTVAPSSSS